MAEILHQVTLAASAEQVFDALTTRDGLAGWWTADVRGECAEGGTLEFGFDDHRVVFRMRVDELAPRERVAWTCLGEVDEWTGTRVQFELEERDGHTTLRFTHAGWASTEGAFRVCNTDWGRLMHSLKDHVEGRDNNPLMA